MGNKLDRIAMARMLYEGDGKFIQFEPDVCGFINKNGRVELIDPVNGDIWKKPLNLYYITENTIILNDRDLSKNYIKSYVIDRHKFTTIFSLESELVVVEDIMYEGMKGLTDYISGRYHTIYDLDGHWIGEVWTDTARIRVTNVDTDIYMITADNTLDGESETDGTTSFYYYNKQLNKLESLIEYDNKHYYENIADGKYVVYNKQDYKDSEVINLKTLLLRDLRGPSSRGRIWTSAILSER